MSGRALGMNSEMAWNKQRVARQSMCPVSDSEERSALAARSRRPPRQGPILACRQHGRVCFTLSSLCGLAPCLRVWATCRCSAYHQNRRRLSENRRRSSKRTLQPVHPSARSLVETERCRFLGGIPGAAATVKGNCKCIRELHRRPHRHQSSILPLIYAVLRSQVALLRI